LDVTKIDQWTELVSRLQQEFPQLDLLVNNAGVAVTGEIGHCPLDNWRWQLEVNLFGVLHGCHACREWCLRSPGSHIVNVASAAAFVSYPELGAYNVSKAGVVALSETLYGELKRHGVGVTTVCPGFFRTNLLRRARFQNASERQAAEHCTEQARISADQVADAIVDAVKRRRMYVVLPRQERIRWFWKRLFPEAMLNLTARSYAQFRRQTAAAEQHPAPAQKCGSKGASYA
jgi:short-subunit dehydrogenase